MPAASWEDLEDYETQFDTALPLVLAPFKAAPYSFTLYGQQSTTELAPRRVEYQFALGQPAGPAIPQQRGAAAPRMVVSWNFTLLFRFIYDRATINPATLKFRGALRRQLSPSAQAFSAAVLPYLQVTALNEVRAIRGLVKDEGERAKQLDAWESYWDGIFTIRPTAFPT